jgi:hypothetical protein
MKTPLFTLVMLAGSLTIDSAAAHDGAHQQWESNGKPAAMMGRDRRTLYPHAHSRHYSRSHYRSSGQLVFRDGRWGIVIAAPLRRYDRHRYIQRHIHDRPRHHRHCRGCNRYRW